MREEFLVSPLVPPAGSPLAAPECGVEGCLPPGGASAVGRIRDPPVSHAPPALGGCGHATDQAKAKVEALQQTIQRLKSQIVELQKDKDQALSEINERWGNAVAQIGEITVPALKKDVLSELAGVGWFPYYLITSDNDVTELPGYGEL